MPHDFVVQECEPSDYYFVSHGINRGHLLVFTGMLASLENARLFTLMSIFLLGMAGRLGSVRTINQSAYAWPLQHGGFKVVRLLKWELRVPRTKVPSISKWKPQLSQDWVLNQVKHHFCICYWSGNHRTSPDHGRGCSWKEKVSRKLWLSIIYHKHTFNLDSRMQWISALTSRVPGCGSQLFC